MKIAIDGTAASGKGTLARRLAAELGFPYLDTGLLYRAVGLALLEAGHDPADAKRAAAAATEITPETIRDRPELRTERAGRAASVVSIHPDVRAALLEFQRRFGDADGGAVLDGRDIGTVVLPGAALKIFVTASLEERARRRARDLGLVGEEQVDTVAADLARRDERDQSRAAAPMKPAPDALILDTTELGIEAVLAEALAAVSRCRPGTAN
ncbi:MAG: (d)CMP kinase [Pacificimonas sp.]|jgi:cytidylate kinase|nr:(d)CMP kinase [Pacificimonas sp.]